MDFSLRQVEGTQRIQTDYLRGQGEITPKMRSVLVDWLIGVHLQFHLLQETLYTTIAIIDRSVIGNNNAQTKVLSPKIESSCPKRCLLPVKSDWEIEPLTD